MIEKTLNEEKIWEIVELQKLQTTSLSIVTQVYCYFVYCIVRCCYYDEEGAFLKYWLP